MPRLALAWQDWRPLFWQWSGARCRVCYTSGGCRMCLMQQAAQIH